MNLSGLAKFTTVYRPITEGTEETHRNVSQSERKAGITLHVPGQLR